MWDRRWFAAWRKAQRDAPRFKVGKCHIAIVSEHSRAGVSVSTRGAICKHLWAGFKPGETLLVRIDLVDWSLQLFLKQLDCLSSTDSRSTSLRLHVALRCSRVSFIVGPIVVLCFADERKMHMKLVAQRSNWMLRRGLNALAGKSSCRLLARNLCTSRFAFRFQLLILIRVSNIA